MWSSSWVRACASGRLWWGSSSCCAAYAPELVAGLAHDCFLFRALAVQFLLHRQCRDALGNECQLTVDLFSGFFQLSLLPVNLGQCQVNAWQFWVAGGCFQE